MSSFETGKSVARYLKGQSTNFTHSFQKRSACGNCCVLFSVALEELCKVGKKEVFIVTRLRCPGERGHCHLGILLPEHGCSVTASIGLPYCQSAHFFPTHQLQELTVLLSNISQCHGNEIICVIHFIRQPF